MPVAPRRCSHDGCRNFFPCPAHPQNWQNSKSPKLPAGWGKIRKLVQSRDRSTCQLCGKLTEQGEVDHIICRAEGGSDRIDNLRWLCGGCHRSCTMKESARGHKRSAARRRK